MKIIGTSFDALDLAEDRGRFSDLLTELHIPFPKFGIAETADEASALADTLDFPLLIRPSYVLGGQGMKIVINKKELDASYISGYKIKGFWYFDKRQGELKYRLIALCPVTPEARDAGNDKADVIDLFWVYFPSVRDILHEAKAFNDKNSAMPITFDHLLNSRRFNGEIYKEENVYGDREIQQYMKDNAQNQLLESERVKEKIRSFESDMWNY